MKAKLPSLSLTPSAVYIFVPSRPPSLLLSPPLPLPVCRESYKLRQRCQQFWSILIQTVHQFLPNLVAYHQASRCSTARRRLSYVGSVSVCSSQAGDASKPMNLGSRSLHRRAAQRLVLRDQLLYPRSQELLPNHNHDCGNIRLEKLYISISLCHLWLLGRSKVK